MKKRETQLPAGAELQCLFEQKMQREGFHACWAQIPVCPFLLLLLQQSGFDIM
jgi:hypothetical protein